MKKYQKINLDNTKICQKCKIVNDKFSNYCKNCGEKLK